MRNKHDHLGNSEGALTCAEELVRQLRRRDQDQAEYVAIEIQRRVHISHPEHDLGETGHPAHAASADTIAARLVSFARVGTEQPGASSSPRPPVSATARRASASTSEGGP